MSKTIVAFFNNKGGVGKTSLVYHLAWMYADLGVRVVAADLDPQANLTAACLDEERMAELWNEGNSPQTVFGYMQPLLKGTGDITQPTLEKIDEGFSLLTGDLDLSGFEDELSAQWPNCLGGGGQERALRVLSAFWRIMQHAARIAVADVVLMDLGPNLGAINRAALIAADYVVVPLVPDLFSLQGLKNLGPTLRQWRKDWQKRLDESTGIGLELPTGAMQPTGYIILQHAIRLDRPARAFGRWIARIPPIYREAVLQEPGGEGLSFQDDDNCLALLKNYRSLMPLAQEAHKPIFHLKPADGAIGAHFQAVKEVEQDFRRLARKIAHHTGIAIPA